MTKAILKIKVMPGSPEANLEEIKEKVKENLEKEEAEVDSMEEKDVAFGLKAIIVTLSWPEEKGSDKAEKLCRVDNVGSVETIDFRRSV